MRIFAATGFLGMSLLAVAGCASNAATGAISPAAQPAALRATALRPDGNFRSLYSFKSHQDTASPVGELSVINGALIGTAELGGAFNHGSVFEVTTSGAERLVASFHASAALRPQGELIDLAAFHLPAFFLGVSSAGGTVNGGSIFIVDAQSTFATSIYSFGTDGIDPRGGLLAVGRQFFGTTYRGGLAGKHCDATCGTIYEFDASTNIAKTLYRFAGPEPLEGTYDGANPNGGLVAVNGALYGTTRVGGVANCGTVYEIRMDGRYRQVAQLSPDAGDPVGTLVELDGVLYGVSRDRKYQQNRGAVFSVNPRNGALNVLHTFSGADGDDPRAGLTVFNGKLYGTTTLGGTANAGTIFEVSPAGAFRVLHDFSGTDGANPRAALRLLHGVFYGTTENGGTGDCHTVGRAGCGTVFAIAP